MSWRFIIKHAGNGELKIWDEYLNKWHACRGRELVYRSKGLAVRRCTSLNKTWEAIQGKN